MRAFGAERLGELFRLLQARGAPVVGPTFREREGAITFDVLESVDALPRGLSDEQAPGHYRVVERGDTRFFGARPGPGSFRAWTLPAEERLYRAERRPDGKVGFAAIPPEREPSFLGLRACDLAALRIEERVLTGGTHPDPRYESRRSRRFVVGAQCTEAGALCFCTSMGTGPALTADSGADLVLTELADRFLVEAHTDEGRALLAQLPTEPASEADLRAAESGVAAARATMEARRPLDAAEMAALPERLFAALEHPHWDAIAARCLACGSCTAVCPTCFCEHRVEESDLEGRHSTRTRLADSCFTEKHGSLHGATVRPTRRDRYRQWLEHKFSTWHVQFGSSGCTGCGRCVAWCPVGIDVLEELRALTHEPAPSDAPQPAPTDLRPAPQLPPPSARHASHAKSAEPTPCSSAEARTAAEVPLVGEVMSVARETADVVTLRVRAPGLAACAPGQFNMLSLPALGECAISVAGVERERGLVEHSIRAVGATTRALTALRAGQELGVRGPFGRGWDLNQTARQRVFLIAGGIGLAPLRSAARELLTRGADRGELTVLYGARTPADVLYPEELRAWAAEPGVRVGLTVDRADQRWSGDVGVVTRLLRRETLDRDACFLLCGPEVMMRACIDVLKGAGVPDDQIQLSVERHMKCGEGHCGRCQFGPWLTCQDGPVFSLGEVRDLLGRRGL